MRRAQERPPSQQPLARELDLAGGLAGAEAALGDAQAAAVGELELVLVGVPGAGAVVREVDAGEGVGAEVVVAGCCFCTHTHIYMSAF